MHRHYTRIEDETIWVETKDGWLEVGSIADVIEILGGNTYSVSYPRHGHAIDWLELDSEGRMTIDVRSTIESLDHRVELVEALKAKKIEPVCETGYPERTLFFVEYLESAWNQSNWNL